MEDWSGQKQSGYIIWIAETAKWALDEEVKTTPKPGLVDLKSNGAHSDMNAQLFFKSANALEACFAEAAWMGMELTVCPEELFRRLRKWGKRAEQKMYSATGNVNTHKGVIFTIGIFCAAVGRCIHDGNKRMENVRLMEQQMVSLQLRRELREMAKKRAVTHGEDNFCRYGTQGIRGMALDGYKEVFEKALPVLQDGKRQNKDWNQIKLQVLITLMSCIEDSNIISRKDLTTLKAVQKTMKNFLRQGGAYQKSAIARLKRLDEEFTRENISGGGSADLLALTIFLDRIIKGPDILSKEDFFVE